ncbi:MAG TPA: hypothetical protein VG012_06555 [Acidimicrobiia bacterium]|jgi:hypothetical protein|nr:hypothetical protein [Acidimicrobiia bacterium]
MEGRVVAYDPARGLGTVEDADGRRYGFHCTRLTDPRHDVAAGTPVRFRVVPGHLGVWEADAVDPSA